VNYPDRYPTWAAEQAGTSRPPTVRATLLLFAVITLVMLALLGGPSAVAEQSGADRLDGTTLCQEHAGKPGWTAVCEEPSSSP